MRLSILLVVLGAVWIVPSSNARGLSRGPFFKETSGISYRGPTMVVDGGDVVENLDDEVVDEDDNGPSGDIHLFRDLPDTGRRCAQIARRGDCNSIVECCIGYPCTDVCWSAGRNCISTCERRKRG